MLHTFLATPLGQPAWWAPGFSEPISLDDHEYARHVIVLGQRGSGVDFSVWAMARANLTQGRSLVWIDAPFSARALSVFRKVAQETGRQEQARIFLPALMHTAELQAEWGQALQEPSPENLRAALVQPGSMMFVGLPALEDHHEAQSIQGALYQSMHEEAQRQPLNHLVVSFFPLEVPTSLLDQGSKAGVRFMLVAQSLASLAMYERMSRVATGVLHRAQAHDVVSVKALEQLAKRCGVRSAQALSSLCRDLDGHGPGVASLLRAGQSFRTVIPVV